MLGYSAAVRIFFEIRGNFKIRQKSFPGTPQLNSSRKEDCAENRDVKTGEVYVLALMRKFVFFTDSKLRHNCDAL
jgi:hypothetical protein